MAAPAAARWLRLHEADNVAIALDDIPAGTVLPELDQTAIDAIPRGHKLAVRPIAMGDGIVRCGNFVGRATCAVDPGAHVHVHNMGMGHHRTDVDFGVDCLPLPPADPVTFKGYARSDGQAGTRNYLGILTTVNCSGSVAHLIADAAKADPVLSSMPNIDGIVPIAHGSGCGMGVDDEGYRTLMRTLKGYARNANFAGILLVGLGCEVMQVRDVVADGRFVVGEDFRFLTIQDSGGTRATIEAGLADLRDMGRRAAEAQREDVPVSKLTVALQCGGSDGYSGITANPALGRASDQLVSMGGTTILSETPEIYGAEHLLTRRAVSPAVGSALIDRIRWWEDYTARNGGEMNNNPTPGNKRGGLTTILEKSVGAVAKGGTAPLSGVYLYGEPITTPGLVFMDSPGYDPCSVTGQIASGATIVTFTTGRGSVSGFKPSPCIKLATNTAVSEHMREDIDINCGDVISDGVSIQSKADEIFETIVRVASGEKTRSEELGFGDVEFVPWQIGAVM